MTQQHPDYPAGPSKARAEGSMDRVKDVAADAREYADGLAEQARAYGQKAQEAAKDFKPYVEKSMKERPMQTLAVASVIGFVLGALWKK
jgi:ElaB/YqjD/DUF883 family membrane-anchored ribosome-binding protein